MKRIVMITALAMSAFLAPTYGAFVDELITYSRDTGTVLGYLYNSEGVERTDDPLNLFADGAERTQCKLNIAYTHQLVVDLSAVDRGTRPTYCAVHNDKADALHQLLIGLIDDLCENQGITKEILNKAIQRMHHGEGNCKDVADFDSDDFCKDGIPKSYTRMKKFWTDHAAILSKVTAI